MTTDSSNWSRSICRVVMLTTAAWATNPSGIVPRLIRSACRRRSGLTS
jgi:hypothetical protein